MYRVWDGERGRCVRRTRRWALRSAWRGEADGVPAATVFNLLAANVAAFTPEKVGAADRTERVRYSGSRVCLCGQQARQ